MPYIYIINYFIIITSGSQGLYAFIFILYEFQLRDCGSYALVYNYNYNNYYRPHIVGLK